MRVSGPPGSTVRLSIARPIPGAAGRPGAWRLLRLGLLVGGLVALAGWVVAAKVSDLLLPVGTDQGLFSLIGLAILRGELPYADVWDNKPPGLYYLYAAMLAWFPSHASDCAPPLLQLEQQVRVPCGHAGTMLLDASVTAAIGLALFGIGRSMVGGRLAAVSVGLFLLFAVQAPLSHGGAKPELLVLLPETLTLGLVWQYLRSGRVRWTLLAGLTLGLALLVKQTAATTALVALALVLAQAQPDLSRWHWSPVLAAVGSLGLGVSLVVLPVLAYFWSHGALAELLYAVIGFNLAYAQTAGEPLFARAVAGSWRVFRDSQALLWLLALIGLVQLGPRALKSQVARLLCLWVLGDIAAVSMGGGRFYAYYYLQLVPSLSLVAAVGLAALWQRLGQAPEEVALAPAARRLWLGLSLAAVLVLSIPLQSQVLLRTLHERILHWVPSEAERAAAAIRRSPEGALVVWGDASQLYVLTGRQPGSRFVHAVAVSDRWARSGRTAEHRAEFLAELRRRQPMLVALDPWTEREDPDGALLLHPRSFPALRELLERDYAPSPLDSGSFDLYVRQARSGTATDAS